MPRQGPAVAAGPARSGPRVGGRRDGERRGCARVAPTRSRPDALDRLFPRVQLPNGYTEPSAVAAQVIQTGRDRRRDRCDPRRQRSGSPFRRAAHSTASTMNPSDCMPAGQPFDIDDGPRPAAGRSGVPLLDRTRRHSARRSAGCGSSDDLAYWTGSLDDWATISLDEGGQFGVSLEPAGGRHGRPARPGRRPSRLIPRRRPPALGRPGVSGCAGTRGRSWRSPGPASARSRSWPACRTGCPPGRTCAGRRRASSSSRRSCSTRPGPGSAR